ncbi:hypothetical protein CBM2629_A220020 [Cupriavidus taiwanensis]|nr:hypothetical protein CBM2629_A220020 [Cupriavidus taiwanensis]
MASRWASGPKSSSRSRWKACAPTERAARCGGQPAVKAGACRPFLLYRTMRGDRKALCCASCDEHSTMARGNHHDPGYCDSCHGGGQPCPQLARAHHYEHSLHVPIPVAIPATPSPLMLYLAVLPWLYGPQRFPVFPGAIPCTPKRKSIR